MPSTQKHQHISTSHQTKPPRPLSPPFHTAVAGKDLWPRGEHPSMERTARPHTDTSTARGQSYSQGLMAFSVAFTHLAAAEHHLSPSSLPYTMRKASGVPNGPGTAAQEPMGHTVVHRGAGSTKRGSHGGWETGRGCALTQRASAPTWLEGGVPKKVRGKCSPRDRLLRPRAETLLRGSLEDST